MLDRTWVPRAFPDHNLGVHVFLCFRMGVVYMSNSSVSVGRQTCLPSKLEKYVMKVNVFLYVNFM